MTGDGWQQFSARMRELRHLESIGGLLSWDEQTFMPPKAAPGRAAATGTLAAIQHERLTSPGYGALLEELSGQDLDGERRAMVEMARRARDMAVKLPAELVREMAEMASRSQAAWVKARAEDDFSIFEPLLQHMLDLKAQQAEHLGYEKEPYDAHLDLFERGATAEQLQPMFDSVTAGITPTLEAVLATNGADRSFPPGPYDAQALLRYCTDLLARFGYDMQAGRLDLSAHPFTSGVGPQDARLTTRIDVNDPKEAILATIHEMGHGLYHLGQRQEWVETTIGASVSLGVDESQSRLWENHVGRSLAFWEGELPRAQKSLPQLASASAERIYRAVNRVQRSLIRVKADEVTYPLHVAVRFEIERSIAKGELKAADLPAAWNDLYTRRLGVRPPNDADGVLQDIHWSIGYLGYFPTYLIGSVYAAALFDAFTKQAGGAEAVTSQFRKGNFAPLLGWLRTNVHEPGSSRLPAEIIAAATGHPATAGIDTGPFTAYIHTKYAELYGL
ncbi:MAG TPA: carboxypeptidase M32 [Actinomycetota bacterium]|nr:carboxypeptidase M32 [Actinomycetota bacterium]